MQLGSDDAVPDCSGEPSASNTQRAAARASSRTAADVEVTMRMHELLPDALPDHRMNAAPRRVDGQKVERSGKKFKREKLVPDGMNILGARLCNSVRAPSGSAIRSPGRRGRTRPASSRR